MIYAYFVSHLSWISLVFLALAILNTLLVLIFLKTSVITTGKVIALDESAEGTMPRIQFQTQNGHPQEFRVRTTSSRENWSVGTNWPVRYVSRYPQWAQVDGPAHRWITTLLLMAAFTASLFF